MLRDSTRTTREMRGRRATAEACRRSGSDASLFETVLESRRFTENALQERKHSRVQRTTRSMRKLTCDLETRRGQKRFPAFLVS
jgi:hypothetical protein